VSLYDGFAGAKTSSADRNPANDEPSNIADLLAREVTDYVYDVNGSRVAKIRTTWTWMRDGYGTAGVRACIVMRTTARRRGRLAVERILTCNNRFSQLLLKYPYVGLSRRDPKVRNISLRQECAEI
jgi:hypothetical protein